MTTPNDDELGRRIAEAVTHHVPEATRVQHLRAMTAASGVTSSPAPVPPWRVWLRRALASGTAVTAFGVPGIAVAAQDALPGDALYGVKRASERVIALVDEDVATEHRAEEMAALLEDGDRPEDLAALLAEVSEHLRTVGASDRAVARLQELAVRAAERLDDVHADGDDGRPEGGPGEPRGRSGEAPGRPADDTDDEVDDQVDDRDADGEQGRSGEAPGRREDHRGNSGSAPGRTGAVPPDHAGDDDGSDADESGDDADDHADDDADDDRLEDPDDAGNEPDAGDADASPTDRRPDHAGPGDGS